MRPTAFVMNMYYTGLGIARSLGERGVPVVGLTAQRGVYGNFTRYARTVHCPDSRHEPEALLAFLLRLAEQTGAPGVLFPTRDDDLVFLDRFRCELERRFILAAPDTAVLNVCLNKWETHVHATRAGVRSPNTWLVESAADLGRIAEEVTFPCVLKPLASHHWRQAGNWRLAGGRKAIGIASKQELLAEYEIISKGESRAVVQEMIPGGDNSLAVVACYWNAQSKWVAGFHARKLLQTPELFGTGCIVQADKFLELRSPTLRLLEQIRFTGIAEVEFKWNSHTREYQLIEINPRPWDQHRLGKACGTDLIYIAYCDYTKLPQPEIERRGANTKWIAEDALLMTAGRMIWKRDRKLLSILRLARGRRIYAIWSAKDPLPFAAYLAFRFIPALAAACARLAARVFSGRTRKSRIEGHYEGHLQNSKSHG
jgi:predicted ATP-grasp superfamily ATP-dependent carboligase